jgi:hypothetical protein
LKEQANILTQNLKDKLAQQVRKVHEVCKARSGNKGDTGSSLAFNWDGTKLGVKVEGSSDPYSYTELIGATGPQGPQGVAGVNGRDGVDGKDGKDGKDGTNGIDGTDGQDGYTPIKGVDYWTNQDKAEIVADVLAEIEDADEEVF